MLQKGIAEAASLLQGPVMIVWRSWNTGSSNYR